MERNQYYAVSKSECQRIHNDKKLNFKYGTIYREIDNSNSSTHYTEEIKVYGERYGSGSCDGESFTEKGEFFNNHVLRYIGRFITFIINFKSFKFVLVTINTESIEVPYNIEESSIFFDNVEIPIDLNHYSKPGTTYYWNIQEQNCTGKIQEVYIGSAKLYRSKKENINDVVLIRNNETHQYMGLQLVNNANICGLSGYSSSTKNIFVLVNGTNNTGSKSWYIQNLDKEAIQVNQYSHVRSFLEIMSIEVGQFWSEAFSKITERICENERIKSETNLAIMEYDIGKFI